MFSVRSDGSGLKRLTNTGNVGGARLSPDGKRILYAEHHDGAAFNYYLMHADGSRRQLVTTEPVTGRVCWAPAAGLLLYDHYDRERRAWSLMLASTRTAGQAEIAFDNGALRSVYLSPDGGEVWGVIKESGGPESLWYHPVGTDAWFRAETDVVLPDGSWLESVSLSGRFVLIGSFEDDRRYLLLLERDPVGPVLRPVGRWPGGKAHVWSEDDRLAYLAAAGIMVFEPGDGEPRLFWPRDGLTDLLDWQDEEIFFAVRTPEEFLLAKTDGRDETELVHTEADRRERR